MTQLVYTIESETSLTTIMKSLLSYMKGLVYDKITVMEQGKQRIVLQKEKNGYKLFGCVFTPEMIKKRYS
ncbi:MAG: hypothetical protein C0594_12405 [Marinilabiliales bacterium]|nr:MAG: hypothetical protein C0594_12405 [Marinilabiliales bacterium]